MDLLREVLFFSTLLSQLCIVISGYVVADTFEHTCTLKYLSMMLTRCWCTLLSSIVDSFTGDAVNRKRRWGSTSSGVDTSKQIDETDAATLPVVCSGC